VLPVTSRRVKKTTEPMENNQELDITKLLTQLAAKADSVWRRGFRRGELANSASMAFAMPRRVIWITPPTARYPVPSLWPFHDGSGTFFLEIVPLEPKLGFSSSWGALAVVKCPVRLNSQEPPAGLKRGLNGECDSPIFQPESLGRFGTGGLARRRSFRKLGPLVIPEQSFLENTSRWACGVDHRIAGKKFFSSMYVPPNQLLCVMTFTPGDAQDFVAGGRSRASTG